MKLTVPRAIYDEMINECLQGMPNEACGFLGGGKDDVVTKIYPLTNEAASPVFYRPASREMIAAFSDMDQHSIDLVAIFHSHVATEPYPSATDRREAHYPDTVYLIVGFVDPGAPQTRGFLIHKKDWRDEDGEIEEVDVVIS
ncbi:MAG: Mov34/MPN/PAD-1 family protein [Actinomycetota bacterium]